MPYREMGDPNAGALKKIEKEIANEKEPVFSILLPENIRVGANLQIFEDVLDSVKPEGIVFYSASNGILRHFQSEPIPNNQNRTIHIYHNIKSGALLVIEVNKNKPEHSQATITRLQTKES